MEILTKPGTKSETAEQKEQQKWNNESLVKVWDGALERHSDYQNLHDSGGTKAQLNELRDSVDEASDDEGEVDTNGNNGAEITFDSEGGDDFEMTEEEASDAEQSQPSIPPTSEVPSGMAPPPPVFPGSIRDENLKKLLMSWYYSGYYTGLWEGSQQAQNSVQQNQEAKQ